MTITAMTIFLITLRSNHAATTAATTSAYV